MKSKEASLTVHRQSLLLESFSLKNTQNNLIYVFAFFTFWSAHANRSDTRCLWNCSNFLDIYDRYNIFQVNYLYQGLFPISGLYRILKDLFYYCHVSHHQGSPLELQQFYIFSYYHNIPYFKRFIKFVDFYSFLMIPSATNELDVSDGCCLAVMSITFFERRLPVS